MFKDTLVKIQGQQGGVQLNNQHLKTVLHDFATLPKISDWLYHWHPDVPYFIILLCLIPDGGDCYHLMG